MKEQVADPSCGEAQREPNDHQRDPGLESSFVSSH